MEKLPPLSSLLAFEAFYRAASITDAAELLGRTHSAVSKQLHQLQDHAGTELFRKRGLTLELTKDGRDFAQTVASHMDAIRRAYGELSGGRAEVTIAASSTFARQWLIPTIARFNNDRPDIEILVRVSGPMGSRKLEGPVDLVISWDRLLSPDIEHPDAISLGAVHIGPVLSPSCHYSVTPTKLAVATIIHRRDGEAAWARWSRQSGIEVSRERELTFDLSALTFEAAEQGMGAALAPKFLIERELKSGALVAPAGFLKFARGLLVRPSSEKPKPGKTAQVFFDWLIENATLGDDGFMQHNSLPSPPPSGTLIW